MIAYLYRGGPAPVPISVDRCYQHMDLIANSIVYTPARARQIVARVIETAGDCGCGPAAAGRPIPSARFLEQALAEKLTGADVFR